MNSTICSRTRCTRNSSSTKSKFEQSKWNSTQDADWTSLWMMNKLCRHNSRRSKKSSDQMSTLISEVSTFAFSTTRQSVWAFSTSSLTPLGFPLHISGSFSTLCLGGAFVLSTLWRLPKIPLWVIFLSTLSESSLIMLAFLVSLIDFLTLFPGDNVVGETATKIKVPFKKNPSLN